MKKYLIPLGIMAFALVFIGAGCRYSLRGNNDNNNTKVPDNTNTSLSLTAKSLGDGAVQFNWTIPANMDTSGGFKILHSAKSDPQYPGAFWYRQSSNKREATWSNIPTGKRFFKICQYLQDDCKTYSNIVELEVK